MGAEEKGRGRLSRSASVLTPEQRQVLGTDRFFDVEDVAAILGCSEQSVRDAIKRGSLAARYVPAQRGGTKVAVRGLEVIRWRDCLAGLSDGPDENYKKVE